MDLDRTARDEQSRRRVRSRDSLAVSAATANRVLLSVDGGAVFTHIGVVPDAEGLWIGAIYFTSLGVLRTRDETSSSILLPPVLIAAVNRAAAEPLFT